MCGWPTHSTTHTSSNLRPRRSSNGAGSGRRGRRGGVGGLAFGERWEDRADGEDVGGVELGEAESFEAFEACPELGAVAGEADRCGRVSRSQVVPDGSVCRAKV